MKKILKNKIIINKIENMKKMRKIENKEYFLLEMWKLILIKVRLMHSLVNSDKLSLINKSLFRSKKFGLDQYQLKETKRRICQLKQQLF